MAMSLLFGDESKTKKTSPKGAKNYESLRLPGKFQLCSSILMSQDLGAIVLILCVFVEVV